MATIGPALGAIDVKRTSRAVFNRFCLRFEYLHSNLSFKDLCKTIKLLFFAYSRDAEHYVAKLSRATGSCPDLSELSESISGLLSVAARYNFPNKGFFEIHPVCGSSARPDLTKPPNWSWSSQKEGCKSNLLFLAEMRASGSWSWERSRNCSTLNKHVFTEKSCASRLKLQVCLVSGWPCHVFVRVHSS